VSLRLLIERLAALHAGDSLADDEFKLAKSKRLPYGP